MDSVGLDRHKRESQLSVLAEDGTVTERRITTSRDRFAAALGHEVVVADPNFAPMYAPRSRRVKTDRRDARTLAEACKVGAYRRAY